MDFFNLNRVPFKLRTSSTIKENFSPLNIFISKKDDEIIHQFNRIDPITGKQLFEIPIYMTEFLPAKETDVNKLSPTELKKIRKSFSKRKTV